MKEIETSGGRQVTIQLDDDDYDKIMALTVSRVYFIVNHTKKMHADGPYSLYVFPNGYHTNRKNLTTFLFGQSKAQKIDYADGDILNLQRDNISIVSKFFVKPINMDDYD